MNKFKFTLKGLKGTAVELQLNDQIGKVLKTVSFDVMQTTTFSMNISTLRNGFYTNWTFPKGRRPIGKNLIINKLY